MDKARSIARTGETVCETNQRGVRNRTEGAVHYGQLHIGTGLRRSACVGRFSGLSGSRRQPTAGGRVGGVLAAGDAIAASSIKLAAQWEQAVVFRLGKYHGMKGPGLFFIVPVVDQVRLVDMRIRATDIPAQQVITKDNVPVTINGVLFFKVDNVADAVIKVQDYRYAISQYAQTSLRDVIGQMTLDQSTSGAASRARTGVVNSAAGRYFAGNSISARGS
jgi:regulator of protease activity HflC (stomatin/prohibitin superfamily)